MKKNTKDIIFTAIASEVALLTLTVIYDNRAVIVRRLKYIKCSLFGHEPHYVGSCKPTALQIIQKENQTYALAMFNCHYCHYLATGLFPVQLVDLTQLNKMLPDERFEH